MQIYSSQLLVAYNPFLLICLPLLYLKDCLICLGSTDWPIPHCPHNIIEGDNVLSPQLYNHSIKIGQVVLDVLSSGFSQGYILLGRSRGSRHSIRLWAVLCSSWTETTQSCGISIDLFYAIMSVGHNSENSCMGRGEATTNMTLQHYFESQSSPQMPDSNIKQKRRGIWLRSLHLICDFI